MQVILLEKIEKLGSLGDIANVKSGYARNYLIPQGRAKAATKANMAVFETLRAELEAKEATALSDAQSKEEAIEKTTHIVASGCESMSVPGTTLGSYDRQVQNIQRLTHEEIKEVLTGIARRCEENGDLPPKMLLEKPSQLW